MSGVAGSAGAAGGAGAPGASGAGAGGVAGASGGAGAAASGGEAASAGVSGNGGAGAGNAGSAGDAGNAGASGQPKIVLVAGSGDGGDGSLATAAEVPNPYGAVVDPITGEVYIAEVDTGRVRQIDTGGVIHTVVGPGASGAAAMIDMNQPHDLLFQPDTRILFIADTMNGNVYRMDTATGEVAMFAGPGAPFAGETRVYCLAFSPSGTDLYFTTPDDVRVIDLVGMTEKAPIPYPSARVIAVDSTGKLYAVKNRPNGDSLQVVDAAGNTTDMPATVNVVSDPKHLAIDLDDNVLIADTELAIARTYVVSTDMLVPLAGTGTVGSGMLDGDPERAQLRRPHGIFQDYKTGAIYISDSENDRVLKIVR